LLLHEHKNANPKHTAVVIHVDSRSNMARGGVRIGPLSKTVNEPHIMELLQSGGFELKDPEQIFCQMKWKRSHRSNRKVKYISILLSSEHEAREFVDKFNGKEWKHNEGTITVETLRRFPERRSSNTKWLKITNLKHTVSEKQLAEHIRKFSKLDPKFLDVRPSAESTSPSFAFVQMKTPEDAQKTVDSLRMQEIAGQKVWAWTLQMRVPPHFEEMMQSNADIDRNVHCKGRTPTFWLYNLHYSVEEEEVRNLCKEYGAVKSVSFQKDPDGLEMFFARVEMENAKSAGYAFDKLNGKRVREMVFVTTFAQKEKRATGMAKVLSGKRGAKKKLRGRPFRGASKMKGEKKGLKGKKIRGKGKKNGNKIKSDKA